MKSEQDAQQRGKQRHDHCILRRLVVCQVSSQLPLRAASTSLASMTTRSSRDAPPETSSREPTLPVSLSSERHVGDGVAVVRIESLTTQNQTKCVTSHHLRSLVSLTVVESSVSGPDHDHTNSPMSLCGPEHFLGPDNDCLGLNSDWSLCGPR